MHALYAGLFKNILGKKYIEYIPIYWPNIFIYLLLKNIYLFIYYFFFKIYCQYIEYIGVSAYKITFITTNTKLLA